MTVFMSPSLTVGDAFSMLKLSVYVVLLFNSHVGTQAARGIRSNLINALILLLPCPLLARCWWPHNSPRHVRRNLKTSSPIF